MPYGPHREPIGGAGVSSADAVAAVLWVGVTLYAVFGGADFGAGFWALLAGGGERGRRARELIDWAIGPVWEANHVWLIFVLVVLWTAFSAAFAAVFSTLFIPLSLAALGIVCGARGSRSTRPRAGCAGGALAECGVRRSRRCSRRSSWAPSSARSPSGRVPVGNAAGDAVTSWLNPLSLLIGVLFVATGAYLAAVFLVSDARRAGAPTSSGYFASRALAAGGRRGRARGRRDRRAARRRALHLRRPDQRRPAARDPVGWSAAGAVLVLLRRGARAAPARSRSARWWP